MVTPNMAKEFSINYLNTLKEKNLKNSFRSVSEIARIMNMSCDETRRLVVVAKLNDYMCNDNISLESYVHFPTLFKVWEKNVV